MHTEMLKRVSVAVSAAVFSGLCTAAEPAPGGPEQLVRKFGSLIRDSKSFQVSVSSVTRIEAEGMKQEYSTRSLLSVARPNKMASVLQYGIMGATVVTDGRKLYRYMPMMGRYTEEDAPAELADAGAESAGMMMGGAFPLMSAMLDADPAGVMLDGVSGGQMLGRQKVDGVECEGVRFKQEGFTWDAWFEVGPKPLLRKVVPDISRMMESQGMSAAMPGMAKSFKYEMVFELKEWKIGADLPADTFVFKPPEGVQKADDMFGQAGAGSGRGMVGKPAPAFTVKTLGGGSFDIEAQKGKVVVLDFWATWCGPCRDSLPKAARVAAELAEKGVVFCAVNQEEDEETVREFVEEFKLSCMVGLDPAGEAGGRYDVTGYPYTLVIDREGVVRAEHRGAGSRFDEELRRDIERVLGGVTEKAP